ncbi:twin-arginine translocation signal domain-containing protein [Candidatus Nanohalobium constans]|uniref:Twin-arginine translocation signal domain-containing protein n=1 Tax=Candidatus Nanohalobium constans TaxID=2565781 RepID=A0A5Q0UFJ2_9ARCH|nr:twin-arginine translocation signal domain-containing protein [Candidatus Nanohalobium constans]QGA80383.1 hypothetical protein LC1Nh_0483 [Candidatus Nanohalobium constans]
MGEEKTSRREFLKVLGLGTGAAALSLSSLPGMIEQLLQTFNKRKTNLDLSEIDVRRTDPQNPENHKIWFRKDLS